MARIELSAEFREIEALIDGGQQGEASQRLETLSPAFGRRPEYRYLRCLYDAAFRVRADRALLADVTDLAAEQPDLLEATALLAVLYSRSGDTTRAGLFAHLALESKNPAALARARHVLKLDPPRSDDVTPAMPSRPPARPSAKTTSLPPPPGPVPAAPREIDEWFAKARRELIYRRTPTYGVSSLESTAETLLEWGKAVAEGRSPLTERPLPLARASLVELDEIIVAFRRARTGGASKPDAHRTTAIAGFLTAVVLHELGGAVYETAAADGGCKVVLPSGAGMRPLLAAASAAEGTGATLTQLFDRLSTARDLAGPPSAKHPSTGSMAAIPQSRMSWRPLASVKTGAAAPPPPSTGGLYALIDPLAMTRAEVEASTVRRMDRPRGPAHPPAVSLGQIAAALADSPLGQDLASRTGGRLSPTPRNVEALEARCSATYGNGGIAPHLRDWQPSADEEALILSWGAFLGETLIATYGGLWESDPATPSDPRLLRVICQDQVVSWPITRVYMRLKNGVAFDMAALIAEVGTLLAER